MDLDVIASLKDFKRLAVKKLDEVDYDYYANGAEDEVTLRRNYESWNRYTIWPRFLWKPVGAINVEKKVELRTAKMMQEQQQQQQQQSEGQSFNSFKISLPLIIPPMAMQKLAHPDGEIGFARACRAHNVLYCITQQATTKIEDICEESLGGPKMFQMYMFRDKQLCLKLIQRAERFIPDMKAIVVTVDSQVLGRREKDIKNKFNPKSRGVEIVNWTKEDDKVSETSSSDSAVKIESSSNSDSTSSSWPSSSSSSSTAVAAVSSRIGQRDPNLTWDDIRWVMENTKLPVILKGILHPADAVKAAEIGCSGIWISNHGGRQLDGGVGTSDALPFVSEALRKWEAFEDASDVPKVVPSNISKLKQTAATATATTTAATTTTAAKLNIALVGGLTGAALAAARMGAPGSFVTLSAIVAANLLRMKSSSPSDQDATRCFRQRPLLIVDGGITRGTTMLKGLLLGADLVCVGRPLLYALAVNGSDAVNQGLSILKEELKTAMALSGVNDVEKVFEDASVGGMIQLAGEEKFSRSSKL
eukprot:TRINITY_DN8903_c2_g1_i2.p1 TRINITY_DN8903_c2_g1~~TRINITY_DN8903_c2_g1_i2.p1  ORF type:complete len:532 (+),score=94.96 TRINITY_DN8903_c2_g1_i2:50-1645(+)